jgi:malonyl-CoA/methylmalonyl-CoA synthetase
VELEIDTLPGVLESAVIGLPHPDFGEGVTAVVVANGANRVTEEDILTALESRLARYKQPKRVLLVPDLPRNATGKIEKNVLRQKYSELYRTIN